MIHNLIYSIGIISSLIMATYKAHQENYIAGIFYLMLLYILFTLGKER